MSNYVRITSTVTIAVPSGIGYKNFTKEDSDVPNRLKIMPTWPTRMIELKQGTHWYPAEIIEWPVIKAYQKDGIITIGETSETCSDQSVVEKKEELAQTAEKPEEPKRRRRRSSDEESLDSLAE